MAAFTLYSGYNPDTGMFYAPYGGLYLFIATVSPTDPSSEGLLYFEIEKSYGTQLIGPYGKSQGKVGANIITAHLVYYLYEGERVRVYGNSAAVYDKDYSHFSGVLTNPVLNLNDIRSPMPEYDPIPHKTENGEGGYVIDDSL